MKRMAFVTVLLALAIAQYTFALGTPDFSGTWVLDTAKSGIGAARGSSDRPSMGTVTIVMKQTKTTLSIDRKTGNRVETAVHKLDGTESINKLPSGKDVKSTSAWVGSTLVTKSLMYGMTVPTTMVHSLSADGKVMTIEVTTHTPNGENKRKLIYNKQ